MSAAADDRSEDRAATVIIGQRVRAGMDDAFAAWLNETNRDATDYPGFLAAEVAPPTDVQPDWVTVYRFDSVANVQNWLNSPTRQTQIDQGSRCFAGPATQQVVRGGRAPEDPLVTVVVSHRVKPEDVEDFLAWQQHFVAEESKFPGFRGSELFRPIEGVQQEWTALYRFDTAVHLEAWLASDERKAMLATGERFSDYELRKIDNSFGNWFAFDEEGNAAPPPSDIKSAIAVWVGLYPTIVLLTLAMAPLKLPLWLGLLIGNLIGSLLMTFLTMPFYVNPLLGGWLRPPARAPQPATNRKGLAMIVALNLGWVLVFYLVTVQFWTLP